MHDVHGGGIPVPQYLWEVRGQLLGFVFFLPVYGVLEIKLMLPFLHSKLLLAGPSETDFPLLSLVAHSLTCVTPA